VHERRGAHGGEDAEEETHDAAGEGVVVVVATPPPSMHSKSGSLDRPRENQW